MPTARVINFGNVELLGLKGIAKEHNEQVESPFVKDSQPRKVIWSLTFIF
jgi:hypothetical protein